MWSLMLGIEKGEGRCPVNCMEGSMPTIMRETPSVLEGDMFLTC
jgi:hypothetical protein